MDDNNFAAVAGLSNGSMSDDGSSKKRPKSDLEVDVNQLNDTQDTLVGDRQSNMIARLNATARKFLGMQTRFGEAQNEDFGFKAAFGGHTDSKFWL